MIVIGENDSRPLGPVIATIGSFDGVHRGHRFLFSILCEQARSRGMKSAVVSFHEHPQHVLRPVASKLPLLTPGDEKLALFEELGCDHAIMLHFTSELAALSAREFMRLLHDRYGVTVLLAGYNHHFGHQADITPDEYAEQGRQVGVEVTRAPEFQAPLGLKVSSSAIRRLLQGGDVAQAASLLGRHYSISGTVTSGQHIGTGLGFPTANVGSLSPLKLIPAHGAYAAVAITDDGLSFPAMVNIGTRPTVAQGDATVSIEAHLIGFDADIYGRQLTLRFVERLRDEVRFSSVSRLVSQLESDRRRVCEIIGNIDSNSIIN